MWRYLAELLRVSAAVHGDLRQLHLKSGHSLLQQFQFGVTGPVEVQMVMG